MKENKEKFSEENLDEFSFLIKNIKQKLSKEDLRIMFKDCGEITKIILEKKDNKLYNAKIKFETKDSILKVINNIK
jgi:hypothetical protein